jgi:enoyl-CoA hydratase/carnithine racemase
MREDNVVLYERRDATALLTLNRARYRNAQSYQLLDELDRQLDRAIDDSEVRVVVLRGAGEHFSSGHDLGTREQREQLEAETLAYAARVAENDPAILRLSKLAANKAQDQQGYSLGVEAAFADYLVTAQTLGSARAEGRDRLGGVDLALRGERGERPGLGD